MLLEKRKNQRRQYRQHTVLPLRDHAGEIVMFDRRHIPERRLDNISVKYVECSEYIREVIRQGK